MIALLLIALVPFFAIYKLFGGKKFTWKDYYDWSFKLVMLAREQRKHPTHSYSKKCETCDTKRNSKKQ